MAVNTYGHAARETRDRLTPHKATLYRTDLNGTVVLTSDCSTYTIGPSVPLPQATPPPAAPPPLLHLRRSHPAATHATPTSAYPSGQPTTTVQVALATDPTTSRARSVLSATRTRMAPTTTATDGAANRPPKAQTH